MRFRAVILFLLLTGACRAQELYVFSEPASTRPARSLAFNVTAKFPDSRYNGYFYNRYMPQVIVGLNKKLTLSAATSFSNYYRLDMLQFDGARAYAKYRFLSKDDVHRHFRMAAFAQGGLSTHSYVYDEMGLEGDNDGVQAGLIATQLINRFAVSATAAYLKVFVPDAKTHHDILNHSSKEITYSVSAGYLLLPKEYTDFRQTNLNLYLELLGGKCVDTDRYFVDLAPAVQVILNSRFKINLGARFQLASNMLRVGQRTLQVGLEQTILNAWK